MSSIARLPQEMQHRGCRKPSHSSYPSLPGEGTTIFDDFRSMHATPRPSTSKPLLLPISINQEFNG